MEGWIALHRQLLENTIWLNSTPEQKTILITLLLMASHKEKSWEWQSKKFKLREGQFITSLSSIAKKCGDGISIKNVRTALVRFEKLEFLANESTKTGRLITILNWHVYQSKDELTGKGIDKEVAKVGQRGGKEVATINNVNNDNNVTNIIKTIVDFLNETVNAKYKHTSKKTQTLIKARLKEGFTVEDFKTVITKKAKQWLGNTEFEQYLRPETLFGTKFESYLNGKEFEKQQQGIDLKSKVPQHNFEQREYSDTDYDSFISNNKIKGD